MTAMTYATPTQRITDLESEVFQGTHHMSRLSADVVVLKEQGKLHGELLADALKDLRDLRVDLADFKTEVRSGFAEIRATLGLQSEILSEHTAVLGKHTELLGEHTQALTHHTAQLDRQGAMLDALLCHFGIELPAAQHTASS